MTISELIKHLVDILSDCGNVSVYTKSEGKWNIIHTDWIEFGDKNRQHEIVWKNDNN